LTDFDSFLTIEDFVVQRKHMSIVDGVANIHIKGALTDNAPPIHEMAGGTDYQSIRNEIEEAKAQGVEGINYHIDSGGGSVRGLKETANAIMNSGIPSESIVEGTAASAAYYLAASTRNEDGENYIESSVSSINGNIGTIMAYIDPSKALKGMGLERKAITNEGADLKSIGSVDMTDEQQEFLQDQVNKMGQDFRDVVEQSRPNIDDEVFRAGWYSGEEAVDLGLIDKIS
jgi:protease-4